MLLLYDLMSFGTNASISSGLFTSLLITSGGSTGITVSYIKIRTLFNTLKAAYVMWHKNNMIAKTRVGNKGVMQVLHKEMCTDQCRLAL